jgi:hypothetical protein|tara:strand:+ start:392 stop:889 length:498 start_codon:yes stop_codon:yes gene_type:complete
MDCTSSNGRVDILGPSIEQRFSMSDRIPVSQCTSFRDAMKGNWNNTALSDTFFSAENIQIIQNGIRAGVYNKSNKQYVVGEQNCDELKIVMRSIFLQYSQNLPSNIPQQVATLNKLVLDYCVKSVYGEAQGYMKYRFDASTLVVPIALPIMSKTNDKQLLLKKWF